jgi:transaldolase/glucose-6-phosphate isomerase
MKEVVGDSDAGPHFVAITDPGSSLEKKAAELNFRKVFYGDPSIGGRYSVLSNFGMVPAALMGIDVKKLLKQTNVMVNACGKDQPPKENPGLILGSILGTLGKNGQDKVTVICSNEIIGFGAWLEQLVAESTGKEGRGLIPIDREEVLSPEHYGFDRLFAYIRLTSAADTELDYKVLSLEKAGHPVIRISVDDAYGLGQEFFRWEMAIAVAGSILEINPFDQPDVEASKIATKQLTDQYEQNGRLPDESPLFENEEFQLFGNFENSSFDKTGSNSTLTISDSLRTLFSNITQGDYFAILAYIPMNSNNDGIIQELRTKILKAKRVATCAEFGPRFLHSTGQVYKGGPNSGVFLQITANDAVDLPIPGHKYTFGFVKAAEARGDFTVLTARHRRAIRIHLRRGPDFGLKALMLEVEKALS